jgi:hypothetical protein
MATSGPVAESPIECALRLANDAVEKGLIGGYTVAGAFAFIYYGEPFETKDLDLMMKRCARRWTRGSGARRRAS